MSKLTWGALRLLEFSHYETVIKKYPDGRIEKSDPVEIFQPEVKVEVYDSYKTNFGKKEILLRKFTLPDGRIFFETWGHDASLKYKDDAMIFKELKNEKGKLVKASLWEVVSGRGLFGEEICDPT